MEDDPVGLEKKTYRLSMFQRDVSDFSIEGKGNDRVQECGGNRWNLNMFHMNMLDLY